ncbi:MAG: ankyrin repeat domain-containing protein [Micavibrio sp.]|nr:ankyrin repeat domain-containing protein [Micavibrio sp.]
MTVMKLSKEAASVMLATAVQNNSLGAIETLLKDGADPNHIHNGKPVLHLAAGLGFDRALSMLLSAGADVHRLDNNNDSTLRAALAKGDLTCVKKLLEAGADTCHSNHCTRDGRDIHDAVYARLFCDADVRAAVAIADNKYKVNHAVLLGDGFWVEELMGEGAPPDTFDRFGKTALIHSCETGNAQAVAALLTAKANPNLAMKDGTGPMHAAVRSERPELIPLLMSAGASARTKDANGNTPLMLAQKSGNTALVSAVQSYVTMEENRFRQQSTTLNQPSKPLRTVRFKQPKP